jgi:hypothetical protein
MGMMRAPDHTGAFFFRVVGAMLDWRGYLTSIGIDDAQAVAGFFGSLVNALRLKSPAAFQVVATVTSGTFISIYLGGLVAELLGVNKREFVIGICFIVGFLGYSALDWVIVWVQKRLGMNGQHPVAPSGGPRDASA